MINLYPHQRKALEDITTDNVAFYHDMGLGKTFTGAEALIRYGKRVNLVVCQKSKIDDWIDHFYKNYPSSIGLYNLTTNNGAISCFLEWSRDHTVVGVINYDLLWRRPELAKLTDFTLLLDESSLIQTDNTKRTKFILKLKPAHVILLSGTPTGGKYEKLYSQLKLLGMESSKTTYYNTYINFHYEDYGFGARVLTVDGYKNVDRLKRKMRDLGCQFLKSDDVIDLPDQIFTEIKVAISKEYRNFRKYKVVTVDGDELVGDNALCQLLYERQLCGQYSLDKLQAFEDLVESTEDRLIVFYNFTDELLALREFIHNRPVSIVNGQYKDLDAYETKDDSITFIQYQAGAMGLNLQKANKIIYYTPPLSSELYEQSKKRINRIGQSKTCYYYNLICKGSVEEKIYKTLALRQNYTERLFEREELNNE